MSIELLMDHNIRDKFLATRYSVACQTYFAVHQTGIADDTPLDDFDSIPAATRESVDEEVLWSP